MCFMDGTKKERKLARKVILQSSSLFVWEMQNSYLWQRAFEFLYLTYRMPNLRNYCICLFLFSGQLKGGGDWGLGGAEMLGCDRGSNITIVFPNKTFHFHTTIKLLYTLVYQSLNSDFFLCFLKYESFSNYEQWYCIQCKQSVFPRSLNLNGIFKRTNDHIFEKNMN